MTSHGGRRPKAGRPARPADVARSVSLTLSLTQDEDAQLRNHLLPGERRAEGARRLLLAGTKAALSPVPGRGVAFWVHDGEGGPILGVVCPVGARWIANPYHADIGWHDDQGAAVADVCARGRPIL